MAQIRSLSCAALSAAVALMLGATPEAQRLKGGPVDKKLATPEMLACSDPFAIQVLLDRRGFSPGQIDGKEGPNLSRAIKAFQETRQVQATGQSDCATWHALVGESPEDLTVAYVISAMDATGPFTKNIPPALPDQASLPALGYTSPIEKLAETFHSAPALLQQLNPGVQFTAGTEIKVPNVRPFDAEAPKVVPDTTFGDVAVTVAREESSLRVTRADGALVFFAPVTTGSEHDPLPTGDWKVTAVNWRPTFHYNPNLFWDAKATDTKAAIKPGPNNPVGVVWIDVNIDHYGIHGTPEPSRIAKTESHGCVRLTNWDAARLASLVKPGTPVHFR